ncbi:Small ubiquitin-related modifier [Halotydeus destructor]|nr:Small ubiquitin-related modifier [Halotydeus destructor]
MSTGQQEKKQSTLDGPRIAGHDIIKLKAIGEDREITFRVKMTTKLGKLKKSYCKRVRVPMICLRFSFKGMEVSNMDTPKKLNMADGDIIEIYQEQLDVVVSSLRFLLDGMKIETPAEEEFLKLRVIGQNFNEEREIHFRVRSSTEMLKLKMSFSKRVGIPLTCLRFLFEGRRVNDTDTPKSLEMVDEDVIEVLRAQNPNRKLLSFR